MSLARVGDGPQRGEVGLSSKRPGSPARARGPPGRRTARRPRPSTRSRRPRRPLPEFDLDDTDHALVHDPRDVRVGERAHVGAPGPQRQPARPHRWVAQVRDRLTYLVRGLQLGQHDPSRAQVQGPTDPKPLGRLRTDDRGHRRRPDGVEQRQEIRLGRRAVLEVQDGPVEAGVATQLRGEWRREIGEDADQRLAGADAGSKVGHREMMPCRPAVRWHRTTGRPAAAETAPVHTPPRMNLVQGATIC